MNSNPTPATLSPNRERWLLLTLAGIQFTHIMDFMIMMPLGPLFMRVFGIDAAQFGLLVSSYTFAAGASGLAAAFFVDRFGRKKLLLTLYVLFALATLACALAPGYYALMGARIAAGIFGGVLSGLTSTIVADVIPFERRGRAMGLVMSSFAVSTVAGVPLGLWLATHFNWHAPFFLMAGISGLLCLLAWRTLPALREHLKLQQGNPFTNFFDVLTQPNNQRALVFSLLLAGTGFLVIPYVSIYTMNNGGLSMQQITTVYLCGGVATLFTQPLVGRLTDKHGKLPMFRIMGTLTMIPLVAATQSAPYGWWVMLASSVLFFMFMSGRMAPGMALITAACSPAQRGTFMALNSTVQSIGMGTAAFVGGMIVSRDPQGHLLHYGYNALVGCSLVLISLWLAGKITLQTGFLGVGSAEQAATSGKS